MKKAVDFFTKQQQDELLLAIHDAEEATSGEVRVHIETSCKGEVLDRAAWLFGKLNMHKTALRNGVLFYLAVEDRKFAILGDAGINQKVPADFWDTIKKMMQEKFVKGEFITGLASGIRMAGEQLKLHFPHQANDVNELPDTISFDKP